jgi:hypothetical protein
MKSFLMSKFFPAVCLAGAVVLSGCGSSETTDTGASFTIKFSPSPITATAANYYAGNVPVLIYLYNGDKQVTDATDVNVTFSSNGSYCVTGAVNHPCFKLQYAAGAPSTTGGQTLRVLFVNGSAAIYIGGQASVANVSYFTTGLNYQLSASAAYLSTTATGSVSGSVQ